MVPDADPVAGTSWAHLFFGRSSWTQEVANADTSLNDPAGNLGAFGQSVSPVGDVNGDGFADFVVGAPWYQSCGGTSEYAAARLYLGTNSGTFAPTTTLVHPPLTDPCSERFGLVVAGGGDLNGDGYSDFVVTAPDGFASAAKAAGRAFVYFGRASWPSGILQEPDVTIEDPGVDLGGLFGMAAELYGDVNGDGFADLVIGGPAASRPEPQEGNVFLYYGKADWGTLPTTLGAPDVILDNPDDQTMGFFGTTVSSAGDVNADGLADIVVGAPLRSAPELAEGGAFIYLGQSAYDSVVEDADVAIDNPADRANDTFGDALSAAGDVNGDGIDDICVGASTKDAAGSAFILLGREIWPSDVNTAEVSLANPGSTTVGQFGLAVSIMGDANGDGIDDVAVAAPTVANPETSEGNAYLWFGRTTWPSSLTAADTTLDNPDDLADSRFGASLR